MSSKFFILFLFVLNLGYRITPFYLYLYQIEENYDTIHTFLYPVSPCTR